MKRFEQFQTMPMLAVFLSLFASPVYAQVGPRVQLRSDPRISVESCIPGSDSMVVTYQLGVYGLDQFSTSVYVTFNGNPIASSQVLEERGSAYGEALIPCSSFRGHGDVALYFVDSNNNHDDDFGRGYHFGI